MVKKISLGIPDDGHKELTSLSNFHKQDVENAAANILRVIGMHAGSIMTLSREHKVPEKLRTVVSHVLDVGINTVYILVNVILEKLEVKRW